MRAPSSSRRPGFCLVQPIELGVVRQLARLHETRVILLRTPHGAFVAMAIKERLALAREHDDACRVVIDGDGSTLNQVVVREVAQVSQGYPPSSKGVATWTAR
jgi:hypothetical protein